MQAQRRIQNTFAGLSGVLDSLQKAVIRREGNPQAHFASAREALESSVHVLEGRGRGMGAVPADEVTRFAAYCSTLMKYPLPSDANSQLSAFFKDHLRGESVTLQSATAILNTSIDLSHAQLAAIEQSSAADGGMLTSGAGRGLAKEAFIKYDFSGLQKVAYDASIEHWEHGQAGYRSYGSENQKQQRDANGTKCLLALLRGAHEVRSPNFVFYPSVAGSRSLLPIKCKRQMEAKVQASIEGRRLLKALVEISVLTKIDAGTCLNVMARTGLYDEPLAHRCCDILLQQGSLLSSRQCTQIVRNIGILQHQHRRLKEKASTSVRYKEINAGDLRDYVQGLAMVRHAVSGEAAREMMDGVWMHTLRPQQQQALGSSPAPSPANKSDGRSTGSVSVRDRKSKTAGKGKGGGGVGADPSWLVDVNHALSELGVTHHKYIAHSARQLRTQIHRLTPQEWVKVLFAFGNPEFKRTVPEDLAESWKIKVEKFVKVVVDKCGEQATLQQLKGSPVYSSTAAMALRLCGVKQHPLLVDFAAQLASNKLCAPDEQPSMGDVEGEQQRTISSGGVSPSPSGTIVMGETDQSDVYDIAGHEAHFRAAQAANGLKLFIRSWAVETEEGILSALRKVELPNMLGTAGAKLIPQYFSAINSACTHGALSGSSSAVLEEVKELHYEICGMIVRSRDQGANALQCLSNAELRDVLIDYYRFPLANATDLEDRELALSHSIVATLRERIEAHHHHRGDNKNDGNGGSSREASLKGSTGDHPTTAGAAIKGVHVRQLQEDQRKVLAAVGGALAPMGVSIVDDVIAVLENLNLRGDFSSDIAYFSRYTSSSSHR